MRGFVSIAKFMMVSVVSLGLGRADAAGSDAWITTKAKLALLANQRATSVHVDTVDGRVTLHGLVDSAADKASAAAEVRKVDGVKSVENLLQVVPAAKQTEVATSDDALKTRVEDAIRSDERLAADVKVESVHGGVVLLGGQTRTLDDHLRAVETASAVRGVKRVASEIKSPDVVGDEEIRRDAQRQPGAPAAARDAAASASDAWITSAVKLRLLADSRTPATAINVDTSRGVVTLFGTVADAAAKQAAVEDAKAVSGVTRVENELQIVPASRRDVVQRSDDEIERHLKEAIAQSDLAKAGIGVEVQNGVARLTGTVPDGAQRLRAAILARKTEGVKSVQDDLEVRAD